MAGGGLVDHVRATQEAARAQRREPKTPAKKAMELEFLPAYLEILERPPSSVGRFFSLAIMALCAATLAWAVLGKIDVIASAPGRVIVGQYSKIVQAPDKGEVTRINVRDGMSVKQDDVLIELNPTTAKAETKRLSDQIDVSALNLARLEALATNDPVAHFSPLADALPAQVARAGALLASELKQQEVEQRTYANRLEQNLAQQKAAAESIRLTSDVVANVSERYERLKQLSDRDNYPLINLMALKQQLLEQTRDLSTQKSNLDVLQAESRTLASEAEQKQAEWRRSVLERLEQERGRLLDLKQELVKVSETLRLQTIRAPVSGVVQQLAIHTIGGVVTAGQELMVIVPENSELEAEITVLNKDVGFVDAGQPVEIKVDSFPYTKYGTIKGKILNVSRDSAKDETLGMVYPARVRLTTSEISDNGRIIPLSAGMTVAAEIKTGERRIIEYVLSPLQEYQSEALKER
jgi:RTX toxin transport system membrane fusion protein